MLKRFAQCVTIAIKLKNDENGYVDMDISPDNFIITTDIDDPENNNIRWDKITDADDAKCIKIDHESMIKWQKKFSHVDKPMKKPFMAPEVNDKKQDDGGNELDEYEEFDVEKANVYQFGATFIYVLYGQLKDYDEDGDEYWKSLPSQGRGGWKKIDWTPKIMCHQNDMVWLAKCVDKNPKKRPTYDNLKRNIQAELLNFKAPSRSKNRVDKNRVQPMSQQEMIRNRNRLNRNGNGIAMNRNGNRMAQGVNQHGFQHGNNVTIIVNPNQRPRSNQPHIMMDPHHAQIPHQQYGQPSPINPHPHARQHNLLRNAVNAVNANAQRGRFQQQQAPMSQAQLRQQQYLQQQQQLAEAHRRSQAQQRMPRGNGQSRVRIPQQRQRQPQQNMNPLMKARNRQQLQGGIKQNSKLQQFNQQFPPSQGGRRVNPQNGQRRSNNGALNGQRRNVRR